jgi:hypothetical protein
MEYDFLSKYCGIRCLRTSRLGSDMGQSMGRAEMQRSMDRAISSKLDYPQCAVAAHALRVLERVTSVSRPY